MEEEFSLKKRDKGILKEFKICAKRVRKELHEMETNMYENLQVSQ